MPPSSDPTAFRQTLAASKNIIILSGAGLSAPSGISTFRGPKDALWSNPDVVKYSAHTTFAEDPSGSWHFHHLRRLISLDAVPNPAHLALVALYLPAVAERVTPAAHSAKTTPLHVTQNIDGLSLRVLDRLPPPSDSDARARLIEMHGSLLRTRCLSCKHVAYSSERYLSDGLAELDVAGKGAEEGVAGAGGTEPRETPSKAMNSTIPIPKLPRCGGVAWAGSNRYGRCGGLLRPDIVWFGEVPPLMGEIARHITNCDLLLIIGTSALVQPAAGFSSQVQSHDGKVAVFNIDRSAHDEQADFLFLGSCDETLPDVLGVQAEVNALNNI